MKYWILSTNWRCHEKFQPAAGFIGFIENKDCDLQHCSLPNCFRTEQAIHYCQLPCKGDEYDNMVGMFHADAKNYLYLLSLLTNGYFVLKIIFLDIIFKDLIAFCNCFELKYLFYDENL